MLGASVRWGWLIATLAGCEFDPDGIVGHVRYETPALADTDTDAPAGLLLPSGVLILDDVDEHQLVVTWIDGDREVRLVYREVE